MRLIITPRPSIATFTSVLRLVTGEKTGAKPLFIAAWSGLVGPSYIIDMSEISNDSVVSTSCDDGEDLSLVEGSGVEVRKDADGWVFSYMST